jgi:hypothetical protein
MIDVDNLDLEGACPRCGFVYQFTLKQVWLRDVVICRGCKCNLQLDDHLNTARKARTAIRQAFGELEKSLNSLRTIRLRL